MSRINLGATQTTVELRRAARGSRRLSVAALRARVRDAPQRRRYHLYRDGILYATREGTREAGHNDVVALYNLHPECRWSVEYSLEEG